MFRSVGARRKGGRKADMEIEYKAEYKSDADRVTEILRSEGYQVERGIMGLNINNGKHTIGVVLEPEPEPPFNVDPQRLTLNKDGDTQIVRVEAGDDVLWRITEG